MPDFTRQRIGYDSNHDIRIAYRLLGIRSASEAIVPASDADPEKTSPMGPSLVDSDEEPFASRLPGLTKHLSKHCEVSFSETVLNLP